MERAIATNVPREDVPSPGAAGHPFSIYYTRKFDFPRRIPRKTYFLGAIPRTGSTHICLSLWRTGVMGAPLEYLNAFDRAPDIAVFAGDVAAYWADLLTRRSSPNGVFGSKIFVRDYLEIARRSPSSLPAIRADHLILLRRRDVMAQAISYHRAEQSASWISSDQKAAEPYRYEYDGVLRSLLSILEQEGAWQKIVDMTETSVVPLFYEDFVADEGQEIARLKQACDISESSLGLDAIGAIPVQRDAASSAARDQFAEDLARLNPVLWEQLAASVRTLAAR